LKGEKSAAENLHSLEMEIGIAKIIRTMRAFVDYFVIVLVL